MSARRWSACLVVVVSLIGPLVSGASAASGYGNGYWIAAADGGVFAFGEAPFAGSMAGRPLAGPVVDVVGAPSGQGYWLTAADGGVFAFGEAPFAGFMGGQPLVAPVVAIATTESGGGYWLAAADGGVFAFGDAPFFGSLAGGRSTSPIVDVASASGGYLLMAADGTVTGFGPVAGYSVPAAPDDRPAVALLVALVGEFRWRVFADGIVLGVDDAMEFGDALDLDGMGIDVVDAAPGATARSNGYWLLTAEGDVYSFGLMPFRSYGSASEYHPVAPVVGIATAIRPS